MHPSARPSRRMLLPPLAVATTLMSLVAAGAAPAGPAFELAPRGTPTADAAPSDAVLRRLPAGPDELTFRGETAARRFTVTLGRGEAARIGAFRMALLNAVSLLPERSIVKLAINGRVLAAVQSNAADKAMVTPVRIPPGILVPGPNTVEISAALTHRVDCSVPATYELWAMLDPAQTGFLVPRDVALAGRTPDDLALEPLAEDGTMPIHLRMADDPDAGDLSQASRFIDALVRRAGIARPIVTIGPEPGVGAGFDVVVARAAAAGDATTALNAVDRAGGVAIGRDPATGRLAVVLSGGDAGDIDRSIGALAATARAVASPPQRGFRRSFAALGIGGEPFTGRHYLSSLPVDLPADFIAANDRAQLLIDGGHAASLVEGDGLVFRVNGTLVSSMPFAAGRAEHFQHAVVDLPLRFFHPGHNDLTIEGTTSAVADAQCDTVGMSREPRLTVARSSELEFPDFAHMATLPQIPAAMAFDAAAETGAIQLYLPDATRASIGTGLTLLANVAAGQEGIATPAIHFSAPADADPPGLVVAPSAQLPANLAIAIQAMSAPVADAVAETAAATGTAGDAPAGAPDAPAAAAADAASLVSGAQSLLRSRGFFFASGGQTGLLPVKPGSLVIAAVAPETGAATIAGIALPRFTRELAHWLVLTGADQPTLDGGLHRLVASGRWAGLAGEAVSFDPADATLHVLAPRSVSYVVPQRLVLSDIRPILGGILSDNVTMSMALLVALMTILGISTNLVIRRSGVK